MTDQPRYQPGKARPGGNPPADPRGVPPQPQPGGLLPDAVDPWIAESETVRATRDDLFAAPSWEAAPAAYVEEPAYGAAVPVYDVPPKPRRTGLISTIIVIVLLAAIAGGYFALHNGSSSKDNSAGLHTPPATTAPPVTAHPSATTTTSSGTGGVPSSAGPSASAQTAASCAIGTWTLTADSITVDSHKTFGVGTGPVTLTATNPTETRTFNPDHTGQLHVANTYSGTASDGTLVAVVLTGEGTFDYAYDGATVTYRNVQMPGTYEVDVAGTQKSNSYVNPLYTNGSDPMSCTGNTLIQHGSSYSRTYTRKAL